MLGNKRSHSVFQEENREQSVAQYQHDDDLDQEEKNAEANILLEMNHRIEALMNTNQKPMNRTELGSENRTHSLFFAPDAEKKDFQTVLKEVQEHIAGNYSVLITDQELDCAKEQMKRYIGKYVLDKRISVQGMDGLELIDAL